MSPSFRDGARLHATQDSASPRVLLPLHESSAQLAIRDIRQASLRKRAEELFGVPCVSATTGHEVVQGGCYNYVDYLTMDTLDDSRRVIVARTANAEKLVSCIQLQSEIDTMIYVRAKTTIPIPQLFGYYCKQGEQQYMFMEFMKGEVVQGWPSKHEPSFMRRTVLDFAKIVFQLSQLRFNAIGSLRLNSEIASTTSPIAEPKVGQISSQTSRALAQHLPPFALDHGPWPSSSAWLRARLDFHISVANAPPSFHRKLLNEWFGPAEDHPGRLCLQEAKAVYPLLVPYIPFHSGDEDSRLEGIRDVFCLQHVDLNGANLLMQADGPDAGKIVAVLDWELAAVLPIWAAHSQHIELWFDDGFKGLYASEISRLEREAGADDALSRSIDNARHCRHFTEIICDRDARTIKSVQEWLDYRQRIASDGQDVRECCPSTWLAI